MKKLFSIISEFSIDDLINAAYAWVVYLLFSAIITFSIYKFSIFAAGEVVITGTVFKYGIYTMLTDLFHNYGGSRAMLYTVVALVILISVLISQFLSGGVYSVIIKGMGSGPWLLLKSSAKNFPAMFKMFLVNILNLIVTALIPGIVFYMYYSMQSTSIDETWLNVFIYVWGFMVFVFLLIAIAIYDFSRITKLKNGNGVFRSLLDGIKIVFRNRAFVLILLLLYILCVGVLLLIYRLIVGLIDSASIAVLTFLIYQIFIFLRYLLKVILMRGEVKILEE